MFGVYNFFDGILSKLQPLSVGTQLPRRANSNIKKTFIYDLFRFNFDCSFLHFAFFFFSISVSAYKKSSIFETIPNKPFEMIVFIDLFQLFHCLFVACLRCWCYGYMSIKAVFIRVENLLPLIFCLLFLCLAQTS